MNDPKPDEVWQDIHTGERVTVVSISSPDDIITYRRANGKTESDNLHYRYRGDLGNSDLSRSFENSRPGFIDCFRLVETSAASP